MTKMDETIWPLEAHTKAKLEILHRYLGAWFPIIGWDVFIAIITGKSWEELLS